MNRSRIRDDGTRTKFRLELRSHTKDDEDFIIGYDGWYVKMVYADECTDIRNIYVYAEYNNEAIQIIYRRPEEVCVVASSHDPYSEEFIDVILGDKKAERYLKLELTEWNK